jgi:L1 cell adhesion molecule like protein
MLSKAAQASVDLDGLYEGLDFNSRVSKARFEDMIGSVVKQATDTVNETLAKAGIPAEAVKKVLMVGGSSRLKKVHSKLEGIFGKGKLVVVDTINPEEAVAIGATAQASILMASNTAASGGESPKKGNDKKEEPPAVPVVTKVQVVPLSLGLRSADGTMAVVIARGSTLPAKATVQCSTSTDNQESVELQLYEGERAMADDNFLLAKFVLGGVPPMPRGLPHIDVTFTVDEQGQLGVEAVADGKDKKAVLSVHADKERLPAAEVQKLVMEAAAHAAADDSKNKLVARAKELGGFLRTAKLITTDATALQVVTDAEEWLARGESTLEEMDNKQAEVELAQEAALDAEPAFDPDDIELDMDDDDDMD